MVTSPVAGAERTTLIGRDRDVAAVEELLAAPERLVTLVGPAGVGKTRLALHLAGRRRAAGGQVERVDLRGARGVEEIAATAASAAGLSLRAGVGLDAVTQVGVALAARGASLLVLDDFDHLVPLAEETVGRWLELAPRLRCLVTSRQALGIAGELRHQVEPLAPDDAVELFAARVRATAPGFELGDETRAVAGEIVRRLDHLPLAIELAAARSVVLAPGEILGRLDRRLDLLRVGAGHRIGSRHSTLRDALDWSWSLLGEPERAALAALAVFEGGFSLPGGVAVLGGDEAAALDLLTALRERSLVVVSQTAEGETRFDLLQSVRELAGEKLDERGERDQAERCHAAHYLEAGERWAAAARGPGADDALRRLRLDAGNLVAAGRTSLRRQPSDAVRLTLALAEALALSGPNAQALELLDHAVEVAAGLEGGRLLHARALLLRGDARAICGRAVDAAADLDAAARIAREAGDRPLEADALRLVGVAARDAGDFATARDRLERAAALFEELGDRISLGRTAGNLGTFYRQAGRMAAARSQYERALEVHRQSGDRGAEGVVLAGLGHLERTAGNDAAAAAFYQQALPLLRAVGDRRTEGVVEDRLALAALEVGDAAGALLLLDRARADLAAVADRRLEAVVIAHRAVAFAALGRDEEARGELAAAARVIERIDDARLPAALRALEACVEHLRLRRAGQGESAEVRRAARAAEDDERRLAVFPGEARFVEYVSDARRLLERILAGAFEPGGAAGAATGALEVAPGSGWIRLPAGAEVRLPPLLARLFELLLEERIARPGQPIATEELAARLWPEQPLEPKAAAERLHSAIAKLRRRGLDPVVVRQGGGYLLHPAIRCARVAAR